MHRRNMIRTGLFLAVAFVACGEISTENSPESTVANVTHAQLPHDSHQIGTSFTRRLDDDSVDDSADSDGYLGYGNANATRCSLAEGDPDWVTIGVWIFGMALVLCILCMFESCISEECGYGTLAILWILCLYMIYTTGGTCGGSPEASAGDAAGYDNGHDAGAGVGAGVDAGGVGDSAGDSQDECGPPAWTSIVYALIACAVPTTLLLMAIAEVDCVEDMEDTTAAGVVGGLGCVVVVVGCIVAVSTGGSYMGPAIVFVGYALTILPWVIDDIDEEYYLPIFGGTWCIVFVLVVWTVMSGDSCEVLYERFEMCAAGETLKAEADLPFFAADVCATTCCAEWQGEQGYQVGQQGQASTPTSTPSPGPPTSTPSPGPPTSTPSPGPPTSTPSPGPPTSTPSPGPPTSTPSPGPPTSTPSPGPTSGPTPGPTTLTPSSPTPAPASFTEEPGEWVFENPINFGAIIAFFGTICNFIVFPVFMVPIPPIPPFPALQALAALNAAMAELEAALLALSEMSAGFAEMFGEYLHGIAEEWVHEQLGELEKKIGKKLRKKLNQLLTTESTVARISINTNSHYPGTEGSPIESSYDALQTSREHKAFVSAVEQDIRQMFPEQYRKDLNVTGVKTDPNDVPSGKKRKGKKNSAERDLAANKTSILVSFRIKNVADEQLIEKLNKPRDKYGKKKNFEFPTLQRTTQYQALNTDEDGTQAYMQLIAKATIRKERSIKSAEVRIIEEGCVVPVLERAMHDGHERVRIGSNEWASIKTAEGHVIMEPQKLSERIKALQAQLNELGIEAEMKKPAHDDIKALHEPGIQAVEDGLDIQEEQMKIAIADAEDDGYTVQKQLETQWAATKEQLESQLDEMRETLANELAEVGYDDILQKIKMLEEELARLKMESSSFVSMDKLDTKIEDLTNGDKPSYGGVEATPGELVKCGFTFAPEVSAWPGFTDIKTLTFSPLSVFDLEDQLMNFFEEKVIDTVAEKGGTEAFKKLCEAGEKKVDPEWVKDHFKEKAARQCRTKAQDKVLKMMIHAAAEKMRPQLEPKLEKYWLVWGDVKRLLDLLDTVEEIEEAVGKPDEFLGKLWSVAGVTAKRIALDKLRPTLEPHLEKAGLPWSEAQPLLEEALNPKRLEQAFEDVESACESLVQDLTATETTEEAADNDGDVNNHSATFILYNCIRCSYQVAFLTSGACRLRLEVVLSIKTFKTL
jgi:hypothetical protein